MNIKQLILISVKNSFSRLKAENFRPTTGVLVAMLVFSISFSLGYITENTAQASVKKAYKIARGTYKDLRKDVKNLQRDAKNLEKNKDQLVEIWELLKKTKNKTEKTIISIVANLKTTLDDIVLTGKHVYRIKDIPKEIF